MPSCPEFTLPPLAPLSPWTVAFAQVALGIAARSIASAADLLGRVHAGLPEPPDLADRQEGRKPFDQATDILATIECVLEDDLRPALEALQRSATISDAELEQEYQESRVLRGRHQLRFCHAPLHLPPTHHGQVDQGRWRQRPSALRHRGRAAPPTASAARARRRAAAGADCAASAPRTPCGRTPTGGGRAPDRSRPRSAAPSSKWWNMVHFGVRWCNADHREAHPAKRDPSPGHRPPHQVAREIEPHKRQPVLVELIESGLEARDQERNRFLEMADRLARSGDPQEQRRLKEELARMTFGE